MSDKGFFTVAGIIVAAQLAIWAGIGYVVYAVLTHYNII